MQITSALNSIAYNSWGIALVRPHIQIPHRYIGSGLRSKQRHGRLSGMKRQTSSYLKCLISKNPLTHSHEGSVGEDHSRLAKFSCVSQCGCTILALQRVEVACGHHPGSSGRYWVGVSPRPKRPQSDVLRANKGVRLGEVLAECRPGDYGGHPRT